MKSATNKLKITMRWSSLSIKSLGSLLTLALMSTPTLAQGPFFMSYGGRLATSTGEAVKGPVDLEFKFYREAAGGNPLPVSPVLKKSVPLIDGVYQVDLTELSLAEYQLLFHSTVSIWVEVTEVASRTIYPRQRMSAVPYAFKVPVDEKSLGFDAQGRLGVGVIPMTKVQGLEEALSQKSDATKTYGITDISGLSAALFSKVDKSSGLAGDVSGPLNQTVVSKIKGLAVPTPSTSETFLKFSGGQLSWAPAGTNTGTSTDTMLKSANLAGLTDVAAARTNLGLTSFATKTSIGTSDIADSSITDTKLQPITAAGKVSGNAITTGTIGGSVAIQTTGPIYTGDTVTAKGLVVNSDGTNAKELRFNDNDSSHYVSIKAPGIVGSNVNLVLPSNAGSNGQYLSTDGSGNLSWASAGGSGTVTSVNITPPAAGLNVSGGPVTGIGTFTLSLTEDLAAVESLSTTGGVERTAVNTWATYPLTAAGKALLDDADVTAQRTTLGLGVLATANEVSGGTITDGSIMDADINASAAIATSKLSGAVTSIASHGLGSLATLSTVGSTEITDGAITNADINASAAIADSKLATISTPGKVNGSAINTGQIITDGLVKTTGGFEAASNGSIPGQFNLKTLNNSMGVTVRVPGSMGASYTLTLPPSLGSSGQVLVNDGTGMLSFGSVGAGAILPNAISNSHIQTSSITADKLNLSSNITGTMLKFGGYTLTGHASISATATVDFANSNLVTLSSPSDTAIVVNGMVAGGTYSLLITNGQAGTYSFSGSSCTTWSYFAPSNDRSVTASEKALYVIRKFGAECAVQFSKFSL